jgi:hypothetical protein
MNLPRLKARGPIAILLFAGLAGGAGGCMGPMQHKLQGRWLGDSVQNFADQNVAAATGWAKGTSMEFAGSEITVAVPAEEPRTGTYRIVKTTGDALEVAVTRKDGVVDHANLVLDGRSLRWDVGGGRVVVLRRED